MVVDVALDVAQWAQQQFGGCRLGDLRLVKRAVKVAAQVAANPAGSTPDQTEGWSDCKAAYRLFDADDVTFQSLSEPHWRQTRARNGGTWLLIGDTTELDFGRHRAIKNLAPTGDGGGYGFHLHSSLMLAADTGAVVGLAGQEIFYRKPVPKKRESTAERKRRPRESEVWGRVIDAVGPPPEDARFVHVFDAGADNFEVFCHLLQQRCGWLVRSAQPRRVAIDAAGQRRNLQDLLHRLPCAGSYQLLVKAKDDRPARWAKLEVRYSAVRLPRPSYNTTYVRNSGIREIAMFVVEAREVDAPAGVDALNWTLYTSEGVHSFEDAWRMLEWYERRWEVEEYHKGLKTGCRVEHRQYETKERLEAVTAMLAVTAVRLLQLKTLARAEPQRPAAEVVPASWIKLLSKLRPGKTIHTVRDFIRALAGLGGFLGRKSDGEPGWITIWRGLHKLLNALRVPGKRCG